ncbi:hypothetical protein DFH09DRAFT_1090001 [Mycena vulgaris]|nr:hypothetical protein DFH09DRAFT_1090001 [Mycena vulgaris]
MPSPFLAILLSCRRRTRIRDAESTVIPNDTSRLLAPPSPAPVVDHQTLSERLASIVRAKEGRGAAGSLVPRRRRANKWHDDDKPPPTGTHHDPRARSLAGERSPPQSRPWARARPRRGGRSPRTPRLRSPPLRQRRRGNGKAQAQAQANLCFGESGSEASVHEEVPSPSPPPPPLPVPPPPPSAHEHDHDTRGITLSWGNV